MFANAISINGNYTKSIRIISRGFKQKTVTPGAATLFFVNNHGCAITCAHVARLLIDAEITNKRYIDYKEERAGILSTSNSKATLKKIDQKYGYRAGKTIEIKINFTDCVTPISELSINIHPKLDIAVVRFEGFTDKHYQNHAIFAENAGKLNPGEYMCRLGYPFPEFTDFEYISATDSIEWSDNGSPNSPRFPIDGMITRHLSDENGRVVGVELSTPGLKGQSGGPLFDSRGIVYGMQSATNHLHLGFDMINKSMMIDGEERIVSNQPFLHVGHCVHLDIIKDFLNEHNVEYTIENDDGVRTVINKKVKIE